jgi:hypothetical protein
MLKNTSPKLKKRKVSLLVKTQSKHEESIKKNWIDEPKDKQASLR